MAIIRGTQVSGSFPESGSSPFATTASFNTFTGSYYVDSASFDSRISSITASGGSVDTGSLLHTASFNSFSSSYVADSASFNTRILSVTSSGGTVNTGSLLLTSSFNTYTSSIAGQISNVYASQSNYVLTSSFNDALAGINAYTSSFTSFSASYVPDSASFKNTDTNIFASQSNYVQLSLFNTYTASVGGTVNTGSLLLTSSFNSYTSSTATLITNVFASESNYVLTSSFNTVIGGLNTSTGSFNSFSSSYVVDSSSLKGIIANVYASESNYTTTASFNTTISGINTATASFTTLSASYHTDSGSNYTKILNVYASESNYVLTSSFNTTISGLNTATASFTTFSSSYVVDSGSFNTRINSIPSLGGYLPTASFNAYTASVSAVSGTLLYANTTVPGGNTIANTSGTDVAFSSSYTIAANTLSTGQVLRLKAYGVYGTNTVPPNITAKFKFGSTTITSTGVITAVGSITNGGWWAETIVTITGSGATSGAESQGYAEFSTAATTGLSVDMINTSVISLDATTAKTVTITITWSAADPANTITLREFIIESLTGAGGSSSGGGGVISGSGATNYITMFSGSYALTSSQIFQSGSKILVGGQTTGMPNTAAMQVSGGLALSGSLFDVTNSTGFISGSGSFVLSSGPNGPAWVGAPTTLAFGRITGSLTLPIDMSSYYNLYNYIEIELTNVLPVTDAVGIMLRVSSTGTIFDSGSTDYKYGGTTINDGAFGASPCSTGDTSIVMDAITTAVGNVISGGWNGNIKIWNPGVLNVRPQISYDATYYNNTSGNFVRIIGGGSRAASQVTKGVQILFSSGNIARATYRVIGHP